MKLGRLALSCCHSTNALPGKGLLPQGKSLGGSVANGCATASRRQWRRHLLRGQPAPSPAVIVTRIPYSKPHFPLFHQV